MSEIFSNNIIPDIISPSVLSSLLLSSRVFSAGVVMVGKAVSTLGVVDWALSATGSALSDRAWAVPVMW